MSILSFEEHSLDFEQINEWNTFDPENTYNHVYVYGVEDGKITEDGSGVMMFDNIANAQETFKELDPKAGSSKFSHAFDQHGLTGVLVFATWKKIGQRNNYEN
jgi:hypothetical protein